MGKIHKKRHELGAVVVEFALVLPLLMFLLMGIIEFGLLFYNQQVLTNASREGARAGISHLSGSDIKDIVVNYTQGRLITFGFGPNVDPANVDVSPPDPSDNSVVFPTKLTVSIIYEYTFLVPELLGFGTSMQLNTETVMTME